MSGAVKEYIEKAKRVLERNWTGSYTVPARGLYPHQWNWDSGFIAIGYSHYDTDRAMKELESLFSAQWENGMLPHIVFDPEALGSYFPEPEFWQVELSPNSPKDRLTSGITMPPVHGFVALRIYQRARDAQKVRDFLNWIYPRIMELHRYLYRERDPLNWGLACIRHPWESGMDNSPMWDRVFADWDISRKDIPEYRRRDLSHGVDPSMRPDDKTYDRFVYLIELFKRYKYDERAIIKDCPFLVYGPLFNSILSASNEALLEIAGILRKDKKEVLEWTETTRKAISERLYHSEHGMFDFYDIAGRRLIDVDTAAGFMPLFGGAATEEQARVLYDYLNSRSFCGLHQGNCYTIPNYDIQKQDYDRVNYWRGPVWININWLLKEGLKRYGYIQRADSLAKDIIQLPMRSGFYEYYDSFDGRPYGAGDFSWTAALFIDTATEVYEKTGHVPWLERIRKGLGGPVVLNIKKESVEPDRGFLSSELLNILKTMKEKYYPRGGRVQYDEMKVSEEFKRYKALTASLREFDLESLREENDKKAFWINIYNALVIDGIVSLGIRSSVKEVFGFFRRISYLIGGYIFSADDIEHGILRANRRPPGALFRRFGPFDSRRRYSLCGCDPRVHFALVCGSRSCAPIRFYTGSEIDEQLELAARYFINSSEVIVLPKERKILVSMIFKWYQKDFGGPEGVVRFVAKYLSNEDDRRFILKEKDRLKFEYLFYDWNLNQ